MYVFLQCLYSSLYFVWQALAKRVRPAYLASQPLQGIFAKTLINFVFSFAHRATTEPPL